VNIAMNPYIFMYWSASDGMAFKYLLVLRTNQSGVANLDSMRKSLGSWPKISLAIHRTPLRTSPDSDCAYRQNTAYPLPLYLPS
jgi:hypothetical protein